MSGWSGHSLLSGLPSIPRCRFRNMKPSVLPSVSSDATDVADRSEHDHLLANVYSVCASKARSNTRRLAVRPMSCAFAEDGNYFASEAGFFDLGNWTTSFFTGMSLLDFQISGDLRILQEVNCLGDWYREKVNDRAAETTHDLGFLYSLYSVALYKLTGNFEDRRTALKAADELAKRFRPKGGYIQAWGRVNDDTSDLAGLAIIDTMMNLPLLFWAAEASGNEYYRQIAVTHADTTLRLFLRRDGSVYHAFRFDARSGDSLGACNCSGHSAGSFRARGAAWAIYGFALAYRYTQDGRYLETALQLAGNFVAQVKKAGFAVWDFRLPKGEPRLRDTSAAVIAICGMQELIENSGETESFADFADSQLLELCTTFVNGDYACPGLLKDGQICEKKKRGKNAYRARNVYTAWGDYFLMEALARNLRGVKGFW